MPKRKLSDEQLRDVVRSRITKGDAFSHSHQDYIAKQEAVKQQLAALSRDEIFSQYPHAVYDVRR
jgi:hypothetical protein